MATSVPSFEDTTGIVIDAGSQSMKLGFAGETQPRMVIPSVVGRHRKMALLADGFREVYCGHEAIRSRGISQLTWPVQGGLVTNWDEMEKLWHHAFYSELHVPPDESKILHAVHPLVNRGDREKMAEIFFENFAVRSLNLMKAPVLALHASGRTSGVVYENGHESAYVAPVYEGFPLMQAITTSPMTGGWLTDLLQSRLKDIGYSFTTPFERELLEKIKSELCYVARHYDTEMTRSTHSEETQVRFDLPDGQHITVAKERFQCPETLFQPLVQGLQLPSIVANICSSINSCDLDCRAMLYNNIVISGGSTMFPGLAERLLSELNYRVSKLPGVKIVVDELPARQFVVWTGGSVVASLGCLKGFWMTKQEYEDVGPDRVNYKFF